MEKWDCLEAVCMFGEKEWSDGQRAGSVSFSSSSQQLCVLLSVMVALLQHSSTNLCYSPYFFFLLWLCISPCSNFLQGRRSYLGMCKDEWTYLLEQKCQNTMCLQDHKSGIVNLGKTKLATARLYLSRRNEQIIPEKWCWSFFSLAKY